MQDTTGMMSQMDSGRMNMSSMQGMNTMTEMRAHMDSMMRMPPGQMSQMMATHEGMMSAMMDRMGGEMRQMNMSADPKWNALNDSVKQDLAEMPNLKGQQLQNRMRAHAGRVQRLMEMHQQMMKSDWIVGVRPLGTAWRDSSLTDRRPTAGAEVRHRPASAGREAHT